MIFLSKLNMGLGLIDFLFEAPEIEVPYGHCSMYARLAAKQLTDTNYVPAHAWKMGKQNQVSKTITNWDNFKDFKDLLFPGETIVIFYNSKSAYNKDHRIGTHAAVYLGKDEEDLKFGQEYLGKILTINYNEMGQFCLFPRQILAPKND